MEVPEADADVPPMPMAYAWAVPPPDELSPISVIRALALAEALWDPTAWAEASRGVHFAAAHGSPRQLTPFSGAL